MKNLFQCKLKLLNIALKYTLYVYETVSITNSLKFTNIPCSVSRSSDEIKWKVIETEEQKQMQIINSGINYWRQNPIFIKTYCVVDYS